MDSSTNNNYHQQSNSGLSRFNSAPSTLLVNFRDSREPGCVNKNSFESERLISRFMDSGGDSGNSNSSFQEFEVKSPVSYGNSQQSCSGLPPHYPRPISALECSYDLFIDHNAQVKTVNSNLVRQSSSPAGLFAKLSAQNGYDSMKELGIYGGVNGANGELSPSTKRLKTQLSFPSSLGMLSQISEIERLSPTHGNKNGDARFYSTGFAYGSWNDSSHLSESFHGMKREQGAQNGELGNSVHMLSHHLSLPKTSAEMAAEEKLLQSQDSIPCKIRAKRGCATHPRSIAERVRRTRISERMRKLQELVPNMDMQTNTADMLDLAVEYIKDLQNQFKTLSDSRAKCKCSRIQKPVLKKIV